MKKRVVVTFVEAGQGHIVTAEAIAQSLEKKYPDQIEVIRDYIFKEGDDILKKHEQMLIKNVKASNKIKGYLNFQFACMKLMTEQGTLKFVYRTVYNKVRKKCIKHFENLKPDMVISTHFEPAFYGVEGCKKEGNNWLNVIYDPDHCVHGWWDRRCDIFFTNNDMATSEAINKKKYLPSQVKQVNFMARESIQDFSMSKEECREKLGLPKDKFTVILADGAYASANMDKFTRELLKTTKEITIIPVAGRNQKLLEKYEAMKGTLPKNITFIPLPFTRNIEEYYCASDLFITKAGPNAITDCVFVNTPIMTNFYSGPVEKASNKLFTKVYKTGTFVKNKKKARTLVEYYIDNPQALNEFRENTNVLNRKKNGADEIADVVFEALQNPEKYKYKGKRK